MSEVTARRQMGKDVPPPFDTVMFQMQKHPCAPGTYPCQERQGTWVRLYI